MTRKTPTWSFLRTISWFKIMGETVTSLVSTSYRGDALDANPKSGMSAVAIVFRI